METEVRVKSRGHEAKWLPSLVHMKLRAALLLSVAMAVVLPLNAAMALTPGLNAMLPDGEKRSVVYLVSVEHPERYNNLLEANLSIVAYDVDGIVGYEYRWNRGMYGSIRSTDPDNPVVSFADLQPETRYVLEIRAIDGHGWISDWFLAADMVTPKPPAIIVAGDSIASGYTRQWFSSTGDCVNSSASYGATVRDELSSRLPPQWSPTYHNVAWAGAGVHAMWNGGTDSCGDRHESQMDSIASLADPSTWNIVVVTAGINSTNWSSVVTELTKDTALSLTERGDRDRCRAAVSERWNLRDRTDSISTATGRITDELAQSTNADLYWTSYYSVIGSKLAPLWTPVGAECGTEMSEAMELLDSTLKEGLTIGVTWVDVGSTPVATQDWGGWPHPNDRGHADIGRSIAAAIG